MKANRREYWRALRHGVAACSILFILVLVLINPGAAHSPGIAQRETHASAGVLRAAESKVPESVLCYENVDATLPYLRCGTPAKHFQALRQVVVDGAGFDFLAKCGDMMRPRNAISSKMGVAFRSMHKSGEAFDYNKEDPRVLLVREYKAGQLYWRTYLRCDKQDGTLGVEARLHTDNVGFVSAYVFDFTAAAESLGWERISAQPGWTDEPSNKEFWHYQMRGELSIRSYRRLQSLLPPPLEY